MVASLERASFRPRHSAKKSQPASPVAKGASTAPTSNHTRVGSAADGSTDARAAHLARGSSVLADIPNQLSANNISSQWIPRFSQCISPCGFRPGTPARARRCWSRTPACRIFIFSQPIALRRRRVCRLVALSPGNVLLMGRQSIRQSIEPLAAQPMPGGHGFSTRVNTPNQVAGACERGVCASGVQGAGFPQICGLLRNNPVSRAGGSHHSLSIGGVWEA